MKIKKVFYLVAVVSCALLVRADGADAALVNELVKLVNGSTLVKDSDSFEYQTGEASHKYESSRAYRLTIDSGGFLSLREESRYTVRNLEQGDNQIYCDFDILNEDWRFSLPAGGQRELKIDRTFKFHVSEIKSVWHNFDKKCTFEFKAGVELLVYCKKFDDVLTVRGEKFSFKNADVGAWKTIVIPGKHEHGVTHDREPLNILIPFVFDSTENAKRFQKLMGKLRHGDAAF